MTNKFLLLKNIACAAALVLLTAGNARADLVFSTDFTGDEYAQNTGTILFDDGATLATEDFFGTNNGIGIAGGDLTFSNSSANRFRGVGVWLDTTGFAPGEVTVAVDVANFVTGADTSLIFQAYAANGVDADNTVGLDLHGAASLVDQVLTENGNATISELGVQQTIAADGTQVPFTFDYNGTDEFIGLTFVQINAANGTAFGSADLDNLTVNTTVTSVPEPSSVALFAVGLGLIGFRRRRQN